jgi:Fur family ferric uptake transcriptional regulator
MKARDGGYLLCMARASVDEMLALLRRDGDRVTSAKRAVLGVLTGSAHHLTAEAVAEGVHATHPDVHRSTVYRILDNFERRGLVTHVHLRHGPSVYHLTAEPHHHLVCEECDAVVEVPDKAMAGLRKVLKRDYGFSFDTPHFALTGRCRACQED